MEKIASASSKELVAGVVQHVRDDSCAEMWIELAAAQGCVMVAERLAEERGAAVGRSSRRSG